MTPLLVGLLACRPDGPVSVKPPTSETGSTGAPTLDVVDRAVEMGLQDSAFGTFKRGRGCSVTDIDRDGDPDVLLANPADASYIALNAGDGTFLPGPILDEGELIWSISAADFDGDGDDDLFLAVGGLEGLGLDRLLRNELVETGELAFTDITLEAGVGGPVPDGEMAPFGVASLGGSWVDFDNDADLDIYVDTTAWPTFWEKDIPEDSIAGRNLLWRNEGDGTFTEVAREVGFVEQGSSRYSSWFDIDNDGDLDLFENNKDTRPNFLWRNDGGVFIDVTAIWSLDETDLAFPRETFASTTGDVNHDGWEDLLVFVRGYATSGPHLLGHTLFLNAGGRGFVDATEASNLNDPFFSGFRDHLSNGVMGATLRDLDGDGLLDVFAGNGGPGSGYANMMVHALRLEPVNLGPEAGVLDVPIFEDWSPSFDFPAEMDPSVDLVYPSYPYRTHAGCVADLDGDGAVELVEMNGGMSWVGGDAVKEPNRVWTVRQEPRPNWLVVRLLGDGIEVPATPVGARVRVDVATAGEVRSLHDRRRGNTGFAAQHGDLHFGLGDADAIERVVVTWPDGEVEERTDVPMNATLTVQR